MTVMENENQFIWCRNKYLADFLQSIFIKLFCFKYITYNLMKNIFGNLL